MALAPNQDPSYLAYMRAIGLEESVARQTAARQRSAIGRQVQLQQPEIARLGLIGRRNIGDQFEARGVYRSGMRQKRQAEQAASEAYKIGSLWGQASDKLGQVESTQAQALAQLARERADRQALVGQGV